MTYEKISGIEGRLVEIIVLNNREKRLNPNEQTFRDLCDNIKSSNFCVIADSTGRHKR